jgi:hypothetical protein
MLVSVSLSPGSRLLHLLRMATGWIAASMLLGACAGGDAVDGEPPAGGAKAVRPAELPCAIERILATTCQRCHADPPVNRAPFALVTYADTQAPLHGRSVAAVMREVLENRTMPVPPVEMSEDDRSTLLAWLASGAAPRTTGTKCEPAPRDPADAGSWPAFLDGFGAAKLEPEPVVGAPADPEPDAGAGG